MRWSFQFSYTNPGNPALLDGAEQPALSGRYSKGQIDSDEQSQIGIFASQIVAFSPCPRKYCRLRKLYIYQKIGGGIAFPKHYILFC